MWIVRPTWFPLMCCLIFFVSAYDTFLIVEFSGTIQQLEENPVGRWLLNAGDGGVDVFVRCKLAGTLVVMTVLVGMKRFRSRMVLPVVSGIAAWQTGLLAYLTLA